MPEAAPRPGDPCPRCGMPISYTYVRVDRGTGRRYLYAVHYDTAQHRKVRTCYLGPADRYAVGVLAPSQANLARADYRQAAAEALEGLLSRARELARARGDPRPLEDLLKLLEEYVANTRRVLEELGLEGRAPGQA